MEPLEPGRRLAGRYVLEERIGTGGMATVWRARDDVLGRPVAVKILRDELATDPRFAERFRREAVAAARLSHPNVVRTFDTGEEDGVGFIVMEYRPGTTLRRVLAEEGPLDPGPALRLILPVLSALAHAHEMGVVHRDVKPGNILVGTGGHVQVTDFGIAKAASVGDGTADLASTGSVLGTVRYLSPEQVRGDDADPRSDVYSTGIVLYEMLTGRPPFQAENDLATALMRLERDPVPPRALTPVIPRDLEAALLRALARRPEDRYQSADEMRTALGRHAEADAYSPRPAEGTAEIPEVPDTATTGSFLGTWMLVPALVLVLAATLIAGGLALGRLRFGGPLGIRPAPQGTPEQPQGPRIRPIPIAGGQDHDPEGDDLQEHPDEVPLAFDGDRETSWRTARYRTAEFGNLKSGLGFWVDLGGEVEVHRVSVDSPITEWRFELRSGPSPEESSEPIAAVDESTTFEVPQSGRVRVEVQPTRTSGLIIWLVRLGPYQGGYAAAISEVTVEGRP